MMRPATYFQPVIERLAKCRLPPPRGFKAEQERAMIKRTPKSVRGVEDFGRIRLSHSFFMRDFLYSDIAQVHGLKNLPDDPGLAIAAGTMLCEQLLEPLQETFGRLGIRSAYRSPAVDALGCKHYRSCVQNQLIPAPTSGTSAARMVVWVRCPASLCRGWLTAWARM